MKKTIKSILSISCIALPYLLGHFGDLKYDFNINHDPLLQYLYGCLIIMTIVACAPSRRWSYSDSMGN